MLDAAIKTQLGPTWTSSASRWNWSPSLDDRSAKAEEMYGSCWTLPTVAAPGQPAPGRSRTARPSRRRPPGAAARIEFAGLPMGHEFTSLVLALLQVGGHPPPGRGRRSSRSGRAADFRFETFISCPATTAPTSSRRLT